MSEIDTLIFSHWGRAPPRNCTSAAKFRQRLGVDKGKPTGVSKRADGSYRVFFKTQGRRLDLKTVQNKRKAYQLGRQAIALRDGPLKKLAGARLVFCFFSLFSLPATAVPTCPPTLVAPCTFPFARPEEPKRCSVNVVGNNSEVDMNM